MPRREDGTDEAEEEAEGGGEDACAPSGSSASVARAEQADQARAAAETLQISGRWGRAAVAEKLQI